jgi:ABC-2 type transport system permease protein
MGALFRNGLNRNRGQILGWGITLGILSMYLMTFYDVLIDQQAQLQQLLASYPPELLSFFGDMQGALFTPSGFLTIELFSYMPLILGIYAVLAGSGLVAGDEENGTMDLVLAHPISRTRVFFGRLLAFLASMTAILALMWLGLALGLNFTTLGLTWGELALPFVSLGLELLLFGAFSVLMSMLLPSRRAASMIGGLAVVGSFFLTSLARVDERLESAARFSPLNYYQSGDAILGLNWPWIAGLAAVVVTLVLLAWWRFERRDIRVGGEGSWGLPRLRRKAAA